MKLVIDLPFEQRCEEIWLRAYMGALARVTIAVAERAADRALDRYVKLSVLGYSPVLHDNSLDSRVRPLKPTYGSREYERDIATLMASAADEALHGDLQRPDGPVGRGQEPAVV